MDAMREFLLTAERESEVINIRTNSGYMFYDVRVNAMRDGCVEIVAVENESNRFYVVVVDQIEWSVRSGH